HRGERRDPRGNDVREGRRGLNDADGDDGRLGVPDDRALAVREDGLDRVRDRGARGGAIDDPGEQGDRLFLARLQGPVRPVQRRCPRRGDARRVREQGELRVQGVDEPGGGRRGGSPVPGPKPCQCHARSLPITVRWPSDVSETYTRSAGRVAFSHTSPAVPVPGLAGVTVNRDVVPASIVPTDGVEVKVSRGAVTVTLTLGAGTVGIGARLP